MDEELDIQIANMLSAAKLEYETCKLKHTGEPPKAADYLCQTITDYLGGYQVRIPVCEECLIALYDPDWILCYCLYCNNSQWICRELSKKEYPADSMLVYWLTTCPHCVNKKEEE